MKLPSSSLQSLLFLSSLLCARAAAETLPSRGTLSPCVARSPSTGLYYDLSAISLSPPETKDGQKVHDSDRDTSWHSKGHDFGTNFTINICSPVIEDVQDVEGVESERWANISAYYELDGRTYSIGQQASDPFFRGRKLVLNYTDGSPCPDESRRKSTLMSFLCDRDALASQPAMSFVGTMDSCAYFFEIRTSSACGGMTPGPDGEGIGPGGVFGVIALIAVAAYLIGGCAYQRTVMHQRGWRQCPNYSLWAGMLDFMKDMIIILLSSLGRAIGLNRSSSSRGGYIHANGSRGSHSQSHSGGLISAIGGRRGRDGSGLGGRGDVDAENRLIDQLDEEWDD